MLNNYLIIHKSILPDYYSKVLEVSHLMESGKVREVSQAVKQVGISRSTYYKYKDLIFEPSDMAEKRKAVIALMLNHEPGVLSALLQEISASSASVFAITQSPPIHGVASVTITLDVGEMTDSITDLMERAEKIDGVEKLKLLAIE